MYKILDIDMDYFLYNPPFGGCKDRAGDNCKPWNRNEVISFIENNLGLSQTNKIKGRIVQHHHEALYYWKELIGANELTTPFEVIHIDSHADLSFGSMARFFISEKLLGLDVEERINIENYKNKFKKYSEPGICDYLLFAIAFRWVSKLTYVSNPNTYGDDYSKFIMKNLSDSSKIIQLPYNEYSLTQLNNILDIKERETKEKEYLNDSILEPEVPFEILKNIDEVKYNGDFDLITFCISPNYTPESADFIIDIIREYIEL
ncbi:MAG: UPF0489 family protein [Paraclostridium bifermentans]|uniref:UPF0489 family protein n=1 Tax=Paraclostridium bifermentans TaxID=1490 RepID=UPI001D3BE4AC|nr:UPF0489 family protein [Paraclostridium bifermentans]MBS6509817.1 UPF0489 family protein [Paraclostridium bifermentans]